MFLTHVCQFIIPAISILATTVQPSCYRQNYGRSFGTSQAPVRRASATFNDGGVSGEISFCQAEPSSDVVVNVELENLPSEAREVHIHEYPTYSCSQREKCSERFTGELFKNEFLNLAGVNDVTEKYDFKDITLFGRDSIVGRSLVIYHDVDNSSSRWICANIEPRGKMVTLTATFVHPLTGTVVLRQRKGDPDSDTSVFVDLMGNGNVSGVDHQWHVHASPVNHSEDMSKICESGMDHYDLHNASVNSNYSEECGGNMMEKCEIGDLAGKLGLISFTEEEDGSLVAKMFKTDTNLPLSGNNSVEGRSIVIHSRDEGNSRLACANIKTEKDVAVIFGNRELRICNGTSYINKNELANKNKPSVSFDCARDKYYTVLLVPSDNKQRTLWLVMNIRWRCSYSVCKCSSDKGEEKTPYMLDNADQDQNRTYVLIILEQETMITFTYVWNETIGQLKAFPESTSLKPYTSVHLLPM